MTALGLPDTRVVYGSRCSWWDSIDKASATGSGLPVCPFCKCPLFEMESEEEWWKNVDSHEKKSHPGYRGMIEWGRGKCFPGYKTLQREYEAL